MIGALYRESNETGKWSGKENGYKRDCTVDGTL